MFFLCSCRACICSILRHAQRVAAAKHRRKIDMRNRRLLDLCCGGGLAAWGYWRSARFSEIVGVDIDANMSSSYSFDFIAADALTLDYDFLLDFDFIHCSPPCQGYSKRTPDQTKHPRLIPQFHTLCRAVGVPYVIENVEGSSRDLRPNVVLSGGAVGLPINRRRYFHASTLEAPIRLIRSQATYYPHGGGLTRGEMIAAFGLEELIPRSQLRKLHVSHIKQCVPPAMTKYLAEILINDKLLIG